MCDFIKILLKRGYDKVSRSFTKFHKVDIKKENFSNFILVSLFRILAIAGQMYYVKIYTKYLIASELGLNAFLTTVSYSLNAFLLIPLDNYQQSRMFKYLRENISLKTFLNLNKPIFFGIGLISFFSITPLIFINSSFAILTGITISMALSFYLLNAIRTAVNNLGYIRFVATLVLFEIAFKIAIFHVVIRIFKPTGMLLFCTSLFASILVVVILLWFVRWKKIFRNEGKILKIDFKEVLMFSYPISVSAGLNWLQMQGYRLLLVPTGAAELVGIYSTVSGIGSTAMNAVAQIFYQFSLPKLYKSEGTYLKRLLINAISIASIILIGGYIFSDQIILILTKDSFLPYSKIIVFGILSDIGNFLIGPFGIYFTIKDKTILGIGSGFLGLISMGIVMAILYFTNSMNVYTIGLPIIISQFIILLYSIYLKRKYA